jgi:nitronate monooxygenase
MLKTRFTELVGCDIPIQQAPMGTLASPKLAAAVAEAGGQGMVVVTGEPPEVVAALLDQARQSTNGPIGANFFVIFLDPESAEECVAAAAERVKIVDFFYADPDPALVRIVHDHGALASWQVGSLEEALAAVNAGCDLIVAQGIEAGGHVRGQIGLLPLLDAVLSVVDVPVLAAGGIGSGRGMAAAMAAGADGVRVGTRFIAAEEAEAHPEYIDALIAASPNDTVYGDLFMRDHPGAPQRALRSAAEAVQRFEGDIVGERFRPQYGDSVPIYRFEKMTITLHVSGAIEAMSQWAGQSVGSVTRVQPASEIVRELATEAEKLLRRWCEETGP